MENLLALDIALFRLIHDQWQNPLFDWLMPILSGHPLFYPAVIMLAACMLWRGGRRAGLCLLMLLLLLPAGDGLVCNTIKKAVGRPRPFAALEGVESRTGSGQNRGKSMPSGHAFNWFAGATVLALFYRRSWRFMFPMAAAVAYSRVYNGVHYPSDVLAGAILGSGYALAGTVALNEAWQRIGRRWFPLWHARCPRLIPPWPPEPARLPVGGRSPNGPAGGGNPLAARRLSPDRSPPLGTMVVRGRRHHPALGG